MTKVLGGIDGATRIDCVDADGRRSGARRPSRATRRALARRCALLHGSTTSRHDASRPDARCSLSSSTVETFRPGNGRLEDEPRGHGHGSARGRIGCTSGATLLRYVRYLDDFPAFPLNERLGRHGQRVRRRDKVYVVQTSDQGRRALPADDHRPWRPRARPDLRLWHDRLRRRAVGPALDHDRHVARRARARAHAADGRAVPVLPACRLAGGRSEGGRAHRHSRSPPTRPTDDIRKGFVYERVPHVTLKSIANNPDIKEGMSREEIDAAIAPPRRHRAALRPALRGQEEGPRRRAVHRREPVAAPVARVRRQRATAAPRATRTAASRLRRRRLRADDPRQPAQGRRPEREATSGSSSTRSSPTPAT